MEVGDCQILLVVLFNQDLWLFNQDLPSFINYINTIQSIHRCIIIVLWLTVIELVKAWYHSNDNNNNTYSLGRCLCLNFLFFIMVLSGTILLSTVSPLLSFNHPLFFQSSPYSSMLKLFGIILHHNYGSTLEICLLTQVHRKTLVQHWLNSVWGTKLSRAVSSPSQSEDYILISTLWLKDYENDAFVVYLNLLIYFQRKNLSWNWFISQLDHGGTGASSSRADWWLEEVCCSDR